MDETEFLAARFEEHRGHLRAVAYRMLGSLAEADDAVQEAWLRLARTDADAVENLGGWLTTVVGRVCLNMLRTRTARREESLDVWVPDPIVTSPDAGTAAPGGAGVAGAAGVADPEQAALLADSVSLALLVVLETLSPAERLAFVLHDLFAVPFEEIAPVVGRTPTATRQLASRARRRVSGATPVPDPDPAGQRAVVDAFLRAAREGDLEGLVAVLDPEVVVRIDGGAEGLSAVLRGPKAVAKGASAFARVAELIVPALVNGFPGAVALRSGKPASVAAFTVSAGLVAELDILTDPVRLAALDLTVPDA